MWTYETNSPYNMWKYETNSPLNKPGYRKFDYVVNYNCYTYTSERVFNSPYSLLKPEGIYIDIDGVIEILHILDLSIDLYRRKESQTLRAVEKYLDKFKYILGFNNWEIPGFYNNNS